MSKAEERALECIPTHPNEGLEKQRKRFREFYVEGYKQAEKDLAMAHHRRRYGDGCYNPWDALEMENEILRRKQKKVFDAIAEFRKRAKVEREWAEKYNTLCHDAILALGRMKAYEDAAEYLENILKN